MGLKTLGLLLFLGACNSDKNDFVKFCDLANEVYAHTDWDATRKAVELGKRTADMKPSRAFSSVFQAVAMVDPDKRYEVLQRGAAETGAAGWECSVLKEEWTIKKQP